MVGKKKYHNSLLLRAWSISSKSAFGHKMAHHPKKLATKDLAIGISVWDDLVGRTIEKVFTREN